MKGEPIEIKDIVEICKRNSHWFVSLLRTISMCVIIITFLQMKDFWIAFAETNPKSSGTLVWMFMLLLVIWYGFPKSHREEKE